MHRTSNQTRRFGLPDVIAGVSVALLAIPQSLAYAEIAGMPPYTGLYATALPTIAAAPFASSRFLQTGPVAMTSLLTFGALSTFADPGSVEYLNLAMLLAVMVGVVRLSLGLIKMGTITNFMSQPVVLGFTSAAALLIVGSQSATLVGLANPPDDLLDRLIEVVTSPTGWSGEAVALSALVAAIIIVGRRIHALFPGVLVAVLVAIWIAQTTDYSAAGVGAIPEGLPPVSLSLPWARTLDLLIPAVIIAVVGFGEPTAIARTLAVEARERWDASRELISQGVANIVSGISGGFPVGGSFARSSLNRLAGAQTRWAGAVTGVTVLAFMPFAGILSPLPRAALAAIVIVAVANLIRVREMVHLARVSWGQGFVAWGTAAATLALSPRIDLAIIVGVLLAAGVHIYREASRTKITTEYRAPELRISLGGVLFYASAGPLEEALSREVSENPEVERVVLDLGRLGRIDHAGVMMLQSFATDARNAGLQVEVVNIPPHARGIFERAGGV